MKFLFVRTVYQWQSIEQCHTSSPKNEMATYFCSKISKDMLLLSKFVAGEQCKSYAKQIQKTSFSLAAES